MSDILATGDLLSGAAQSTNVAGLLDPPVTAPSFGAVTMEISTVDRDDPHAIYLESDNSTDRVRYTRNKTLETAGEEIVLVNDMAARQTFERLKEENVFTFKQLKARMESLTRSEFGSTAKPAIRSYLRDHVTLGQSNDNGVYIYLEYFSVRRSVYSYEVVSQEVEYDKHNVVEYITSPKFERIITGCEELTFHARIHLMWNKPTDYSIRNYYDIGVHTFMDIGRPSRGDTESLGKTLVKASEGVRKETEFSLSMGIAKASLASEILRQRLLFADNYETVLALSGGASDANRVSLNLSTVGLAVDTGAVALEASGLILAGSTAATLLTASGIGIAFIAIGYAAYSTHQSNIISEASLDGMAAAAVVISESEKLLKLKARTGTVVIFP